MVFKPGQMWHAGPPPLPSFWMHQLGGVTIAPRLDPEEFARRTGELLKSTK